MAIISRNLLLSNMQCINCDCSEATKGHSWCRDCYSLKKEQPIYCLKCKINPRNGAYDWCKNCFSSYQKKTSKTLVLFQQPQQNKYGTHLFQRQFNGQSSSSKKCNSCHTDDATPNGTLCELCYEFEQSKRHLQKQSASFKKCSLCNKNIANPGYSWCQTCYEQEQKKVCRSCNAKKATVQGYWCQNCYDTKINVKQTPIVYQQPIGGQCKFCFNKIDPTKNFCGPICEEIYESLANKV